FDEFVLQNRAGVAIQHHLETGFEFIGGIKCHIELPRADVVGPCSTGHPTGKGAHDTRAPAPAPACASRLERDEFSAGYRDNPDPYCRPVRGVPLPRGNDNWPTWSPPRTGRYVCSSWIARPCRWRRPPCVTSRHACHAPTGRGWRKVTHAIRCCCRYCQ